MFWCFKIEFFPWSAVDFLSDAFNIFVRKPSDVRVLSYVLPYELVDCRQSQVCHSGIGFCVIAYQCFDKLPPISSSSLLHEM